jgi:membrane protease YdiL (CAAX protease family)
MGPERSGTCLSTVPGTGSICYVCGLEPQRGCRLSAEHNDNFSNDGAGLWRRQRLIEVAVFLFLIVPSMALSFFSIGRGEADFPLIAAASMLQDLALMALVLYFLWRNGESPRSVGLSLANGATEVLWGVVLFVPFAMGVGALEKALRAAGLSLPEQAPSYLIPAGAWEYGLALAFLVVVAVSEEVIFRGYLILRFEEITGSSVAAVLLSATIFSIGHGYQGTAGVIAVGVMGVAFAVVYLWRGSLLAPMVMHFMQNFVGIMLAPMAAN